MKNISCTSKSARKEKQNQQLINWAIAVDNDKSIYRCYALLDALNLSYTTHKFFLDLLFINSEFSPASQLKKWLMNPLGNKLSIAFTIFLICIALCAQPSTGKEADKKKELALFTFIVTWWPFLRDILNAFKNTWRVVHNLIVIIDLYCPELSVALLHLPIIIPLTALNIFVMTRNRAMRNRRKEHLAFNRKLMIEIEGALLINLESARKFRALIQSQSNKQRMLALILSSFIGLQDGIRSYSGFLTICPALAATPPLLVFVICCSILYALMHWAMRVFDEYLEQEQARFVELELLIGIQSRLIEHELNQLEAASQEEQSLLIANTNWEIIRFNTLREEYIRLSRPSYARAIFSGMKNSITFYAAFSIGIILLGSFLSGFPPILFGCLTLMGLLVVAGGIAFSIYELKSAEQPTIGVITVNKHYEVCRRVLSSYNKGTKVLNFAMSALDPVDDDVKQGSKFAILASFIYSIIFGIKAFATGFRVRSEPVLHEYSEHPLLPIKVEPKKPRVNSAAFFYSKLPAPTNNNDELPEPVSHLRMMEN